jgi:hypothetical protein
MAFLHPLALLLLYVGRLDRFHEPAKTQTL